jgi:hypothetical protein
MDIPSLVDVSEGFAGPSESRRRCPHRSGAGSGALSAATAKGAGLLTAADSSMSHSISMLAKFRPCQSPRYSNFLSRYPSFQPVRTRILERQILRIEMGKKLETCL